MDGWMLDSSACIDAMRGRSRAIARRLRGATPGAVVLSSIVLAELELGIALSTHRQANRERLDEFLQLVGVRVFDAEAARRYAEVRAHLQRTGKLIGPLDMLIAGHALALELPLITGNVAEFKRVPGLTVVGLG